MSKAHGGVGPNMENKILMSQSLGSLDQNSLLSLGTRSETKSMLKPLNPNPSLNELFLKAQTAYNTGAYSESLQISEKIYDSPSGPTSDGSLAIGGTHRTDNLLLMGAAHFQLR